MQRLYTFLSFMVLLLVPMISFGQCSNQITITYYENGVLTSNTVNNGQNGFSASVCPSANAQYVFTGSSTSNGIFTWSRVITKHATNSALDVVEDLSIPTLIPRNTTQSQAVSFTNATTFRLKADADANCSSVNYVYLTVTPTLSLTSNLAAAGICVGGQATLTATGSSNGQYTWSAPGMATVTNTGTLTVSPAATTSYTVTAPTSCGSSSQQLTVPVNALTISPAAPAICAGQTTTLTASYSGAGATYQWFNAADLNTPIGSGPTLPVSPTATTTYQVNASSSDCGALTRRVTVTVAAPTVAVSPNAPVICTGGSTTLTAASNNPGATFSWSPSTGLSATTGASVVASPTANTTYTVTATTDCGTTTSQVAVTVVPAATFGVTPASATVCAGSSTTLTASSNITGATYRWYRTSDLGTVLSTDAAYAASPTTATTYRVITTTSCGSNTRDVSVGVNASPTVSVTPSSTTMARGSSSVLTASGADSYTWSPATGLSATTGSTVTASPEVTTTYTVTGTNSLGCTNSQQVTVTVTRPLPVELISFVAAWGERNPVLTWSTASEKNNAYFEVQRSLDGASFERVGQRAGAGTTTTRTSYQFTDLSLTQVSVRNVYYRLRQVDEDGQSTLSPVRAVQVPAVSQAFTGNVFPNPYSEKVSVRFESFEAGEVNLTVHNVLGQTVLATTAKVAAGTQELALPQAASLKTGVYYLTVQQGKHKQVLKMIHE
ncbi:T9SS type A sorting domain-containing protein [Hymenobacter koreensis]|uniref:T9SS type A sorting domain-containing protein n=1 Tax=Hymenobacter koreensis TaxID=1084523 RepID=A0ABP8J0B3_9BACT